MTDKLNKLSSWLKDNGLIKESLLVSSMITKYAEACEPPFDKSLLDDVRSGQKLKINTEGSQAGYLQTLLREQGYALKDFGIDCIFGPETEGALKEFQEKTGLNPTGELDGFVLALLENLTFEPNDLIPENIDKPKEKVRTDKPKEEARTDKYREEIKTDNEEVEASGGYWDFSVDNVPSDWDSPNFSPKDLMSRGNGRVRMYKPALRALNNVASQRPAGKPVLLTNQVSSSKNGAYRDKKFNSSVGGVRNSQHISGKAFDIHVLDYSREERLLLLRALASAGFTGFGHGRSVIHADFGPKRSWAYSGYKKPSGEEYRGREKVRETSQAKTEEASDGESIKVNGDIIYPFKRNANVDLVVFYHGTTGQTPVLQQLMKLDMSNTVFLIPDGYGKDYSSILDTINKLSNDYGITINGKKLGAWSAGSKGFLTATGKGFDTEMLADPSASASVMNSTLNGVYMEYNPEVWRKSYSGLAHNLPILAEKIETNGGQAKLMSGMGHTAILASILSQLV